MHLYGVLYGYSTSGAPGDRHECSRADREGGGFVLLTRAFAPAAALARGGPARGEQRGLRHLCLCAIRRGALRCVTAQAARQELTKLLCVPVNLGFNVLLG